ncbi:zinc-binding dehydrogenase [Ruania halotolerans]|uniref:zinc-binding dehydrogenase n=1 Tax=Ruania halotolerans TaxID=2897773 RepID=UPI001E39E210|nr:zinc-binding dehydrogenase [Ruania halotolerans]UFU05230.1 zinc-binding dehydrogenase [Ruania halotolerans]
MEILNEQHAEHATMRALIQRERSGPSGLALSLNHPRPTAAGPGAYLIRVSVAGVNFADVMQAHGTYAGGPQVPYVAGFEAAGEIIAVGTGIDHPIPVGTHVIGTGRGSFAEYMAMPAAGVRPVPTGWSDAAALGMVLNWATALAALRTLGEIATGDVVLIHAAAGGVGQAAIRLAKHYGDRVIATASRAKHDTVMSLGADVVLDSACPDLAEEITRHVGAVDLVLESVGKATFQASLSVTRPFTGRVIVLGAASGDASVTTHDLVFSHRVHLQGLHIGALAATVPAIYREVLDELDTLIAHGVYTPGTPRVHRLSAGPALLCDVEMGRTRGKHALDPWR